MRTIVFLLSFMILTWNGSSGSAASASANPASGVLLAQARLGPNQSVVGVYRASNLYVQVQSSPTGGRPVAMDLKGTFVRLYVSPHSGVFFIETRVGDQGRCVYVLRYNKETLQSALQGRSQALVFGDRGVNLFRDGFRIRTADTSHTGSVPYRTVFLYHWESNAYRRWRHYREPDYTSGSLPVPSALFHTATGDRILLRLQVASTAQSRETGLMSITKLDSDSGMIFVWPNPVLESFWMKDTNVPLTVAFLSADGVIQETQDMVPLSLDLHTPRLPYAYAVEVNAGFFARAGVRVGDRASLRLGASSAATAQP